MEFRLILGENKENMKVNKVDMDKLKINQMRKFASKEVNIMKLDLFDPKLKNSKRLRNNQKKR